MIHNLSEVCIKYQKNAVSKILINPNNEICMKLFIRNKSISVEKFINDLIIQDIEILMENNNYRIDLYYCLKIWTRTKLPSEIDVSIRANESERENAINELKTLLIKYQPDFNEFPFLQNLLNDIIDADKFNEFKQNKSNFKKLIDKVNKIDLELIKVLDYKKIISRSLKAEILNSYSARVCPYCNRAYIDVVTDSSGSLVFTSDFEHFLPASIFPLFQLSLWNVLPSCTPCNRNFKKAKTINLLNPIKSGFDNNAMFVITNSEFYLNPNINVEYELEISGSCSDNINETINNNIDTFNLRALYNQEQLRANKIVSFYKKYRHLYRNNYDLFCEAREMFFDFEYGETDFRNFLMGKFDSDLECWLTKD